MNNKRMLGMILGVVVSLGLMPYVYAGSERFIMSMSVDRMNQANLVYVKFIGPDGAALESDILKQMVIREQNCDSGHVFEVVQDYKIGYAPKDMLVGIYLFQHVWNNKTLCFSVPNLGKAVQGFNPATNNGRLFQIKLMP